MFPHKAERGEIESALTLNEARTIGPRKRQNQKEESHQKEFISNLDSLVQNHELATKFLSAPTAPIFIYFFAVILKALNRVRIFFRSRFQQKY